MLIFVTFKVLILSSESILLISGANFFEKNKDIESNIKPQQTCCSHDKIATSQKVMCSGPGNSHEGSKLLPDTLNKFPWQVSIQLQQTWRSEHICSGALLSPKWVLTVAQCVSKLIKDQIQIVDGTLTPSDVSSIIPHPSFDADTVENDLALLELTKPLTFSEEVAPVCLKTSSNDIPCHNHCQLGMYFNKQYIRKVLPLLDKETCKSIYQTNNLERLIHANLQCAENPSLDRNCHGDPGAAMACPNNRGQIQLTGLLSWGWNCAGMTTPAVFTKVSPYVQWIKSYVKSKDVRCSPGSEMVDATHFNTDGVRIDIFIPRKIIEVPEQVVDETPDPLLGADSFGNISLSSESPIKVADAKDTEENTNYAPASGRKRVPNGNIYIISRKEDNLSNKDFVIYLNLTRIVS